MGPDVDCSGELPDGKQIRKLSASFASIFSPTVRPSSRTNVLASKLLTFATGREMGFSDRSEIDRLVRESANHGHGIRELIHLVVQSEIFRSK